MALKVAPERWQSNTCAAVALRLLPGARCCARSTDQFDVVVAFEERVFDLIIEGAQPEHA